MRMYNKIQVFGLPRSGTNFIEWTLRHNFIGLEDYSVMHECQNDVDGSSPYWIDFKHTTPKLTHSDYAIVIYKEYDVWLESIKKMGWITKVTPESHQKYIDDAKALDSTKVLVVEHTWCTHNYHKLLDRISIKFGVELREDWHQPTKRVDMLCGAGLTNEDFKF